MSPSFVTLHLLVSEMYCLRLFIVVLQELHCCYCGVFTEKYVHTEFHLDWLLC